MFIKHVYKFLDGSINDLTIRLIFKLKIKNLFLNAFIKVIFNINKIKIIIVKYNK